jgi:hypothetical protein
VCTGHPCTANLVPGLAAARSSPTLTLTLHLQAEEDGWRVGLQEEETEGESAYSSPCIMNVQTRLVG